MFSFVQGVEKNAYRIKSTTIGANKTIEVKSAISMVHCEIIFFGALILYVRPGAGGWSNSFGDGSITLLYSLRAKPLKSVRGVAVHSYDIKVINGDCVKVFRERFNPLRIVMSNSDAFRQINYRIHFILRLVPRITFQVSFVCLQQEVADVEESARTQDTTQLINDGALTVVGRYAGQDTEQ